MDSRSRHTVFATVHVSAYPQFFLSPADDQPKSGRVDTSHDPVYHFVTTSTVIVCLPGFTSAVKGVEAS